MRKEKNEPHFPQQLFFLCFQLETTTSNLYRWKHLQCYWTQNDTSLGLDAAFQNHFPLLLQPREHLSTTPEAKHVDPQVKKWPREEMGRRRQGKVGKLTDWFSLYQVWLNIEGAHCRTVRAWLQDLLSTTPSPAGTGQVHFKQLLLPQVVSKLTWPRLHLFSQEVPDKAWFDTESEPCPTLLPCPQIRKIMDIMSGNRKALS